MSTIPASQIVNVSPNVLSAGGSALDLNGLVLTENTRVPIGAVLSFASSLAVQAFFGATSTEAALAATYFAGFDGSNVKPGAMLFAQYPVADVAAYLRGGNISTLTVAQMQALNGTISVTIDGILKTGTVNLGTATSFSMAALLIADALSIEGAQVGTVTATIATTVMTVSAVLTGGPLEVGQVISGAGVTADTYITSFGTGTGGAGTYNLSASMTVGSAETVTVFDQGITYDSVSGAFVIVSDTAGADSVITFASGALAASLLLTSATGAVLSQGSDAASPGSFMTSLIGVTQNWANFTTAFDPDESGFANKLAFSTWTSQQNDRYGYACWDTSASPTISSPDTSCLGSAIDQAGNSGTCLIWDPDGAQKAVFALGYAASLDFAQTDGRTTFKFRRQAGMQATVSDLTAAINLGGNPALTDDRGNGYNFYGAYAEANTNFIFMANGFVSGRFKWFDSFVNQIWLNSSFKAALINLLLTARTIPYNAAGRALIEASLADAINSGLNFGAYRAGVTLSQLQISEVNTAAGKNIATTLQQRGWYLQVGDASPSVRQSRGSPPCTLWYVDGETVQFINLASVALQ
jgi:hypothetical protein